MHPCRRRGGAAGGGSETGGEEEERRGRGKKACELCICQWPSLWTTTSNNLISSMVVIHNAGL